MCCKTKTLWLDLRVCSEGLAGAVRNAFPLKSVPVGSTDPLLVKHLSIAMVFGAPFGNLPSTELVMYLKRLLLG